jgi:ubiquinone/menaquinone biosynthesis C-methylase UbiE
MVPPLFGPAATQLVEAADPVPGARVLDVGCGTGVVARQVARRAGAAGIVAGLDLSPQMLAVARAAAERDGLTIAWHEGRAEALPFADGSFDLALCQFALMFFADRRAALAEIHRVLAGGGRVAASVFHGFARHPFYQALDASIQRHLGTSPVAGIFALGDAGELRALLTDGGFRDVRIEPSMVTARFPDPEGFLAGEIAVDTASIPAMQHLDAAAQRALVAAIRDDMDAPLREVTEGDDVVLPFHIHIARAERRSA